MRVWIGVIESKGDDQHAVIRDVTLWRVVVPPVACKLFGCGSIFFRVPKLEVLAWRVCQFFARFDGEGEEVARGEIPLEQRTS